MKCPEDLLNIGSRFIAPTMTRRAAKGSIHGIEYVMVEAENGNQSPMCCRGETVSDTGRGGGGTGNRMTLSSLLMLFSIILKVGSRDDGSLQILKRIEPIAEEGPANGEWQGDNCQDDGVDGCHDQHLVGKRFIPRQHLHVDGALSLKRPRNI
jgi:hypothetical protein